MSEKLTPALVVGTQQSWSQAIDTAAHTWRAPTLSEDLLVINTNVTRSLFDMVQDLCERVEKLEGRAE